MCFLLAKALSITQLQSKPIFNKSLTVSHVLGHPVVVPAVFILLRTGCGFIPDAKF